MSQNAFPTEPRAAALLYLQRGFAPLPLPARSKKPNFDGWPDFRVTVESLNGQFDGGNVGLILGEASGGLATVDLDCNEANAAAPCLLPATGMKGGRGGKPLHWYYVCLGSRTLQFKDPCHAEGAAQRLHGALLLELRAGGRQAVAAPSVHPKGERYAWAVFGEPALIASDGKAADPLAHSCALLAAVSLLGRYWPTKGGRNDAYLLAECAECELGLRMDKELQRSDWGGPLTAAQLRYAADDVLVLPPLYRALGGRSPRWGWRRCWTWRRLRYRPLPGWPTGACRSTPVPGVG